MNQLSPDIIDTFIDATSVSIHLKAPGTLEDAKVTRALKEFDITPNGTPARSARTAQ